MNEPRQRGKTVQNAELKAMATIDETLTALGDTDAIIRVLDWVNAAHGYDTDAGSQPPMARWNGGEPVPVPAKSDEVDFR